MAGASLDIPKVKLNDGKEIPIVSLLQKFFVHVDTQVSREYLVA